MVLELQNTHHNFRGFDFHEYVACLFLKPVTDTYIFTVLFHECRLTREIREN